jgi:hypothetical protein
VFDSGDFSEDSTFLLNEWIEHTPKAVVAENFRLPPEIFENIHEKDKYIFQGRSSICSIGYDALADMIPRLCAQEH